MMGLYSLTQSCIASPILTSCLWSNAVQTYIFSADFRLLNDNMCNESDIFSSIPVCLLYERNQVRHPRAEDM